MIPRRIRSYLSRSVKVDIKCPHGVFIPGNFSPWRETHRKHGSRYSCDKCGFLVTLSTYRGPVNW